MKKIRLMLGTLVLLTVLCSCAHNDAEISESDDYYETDYTEMSPEINAAELPDIESDETELEMTEELYEIEYYHKGSELPDNFFSDETETDGTDESELTGVPAVPVVVPEPESYQEPEIVGEENDFSESGFSYNYVLNTNSYRFHYPDCKSVLDMKDKNTAYHSGTREEAIEMGYKPCGNCHP